ncbi:hypothetical protein K435DRAFT_806024 [Dendrothele bispora CBS 962.96]|uniref:Uncharacterized protein n=1 Tax=Dendrothele bispora (strain CBS 962.96) TaxID=1314807 RepID=A0A4S8L9N7_DENBC|nr:hypothetical protein K435DRAFT_806024 [Dendrothele bispora CBS 962.96]
MNKELKEKTEKMWMDTSQLVPRNENIVEQSVQKKMKTMSITAYLFDKRSRKVTTLREFSSGSCIRFAMAKSRKGKTVTQTRRSKEAKKARKVVSHAYFQGELLELLESYFPKYLATYGNRKLFWDELKGEWIKKFPNKLTPEERERVIQLKKRLHLDGYKDKKAKGEDTSGDESLDEEPLKDTSQRADDPADKGKAKASTHQASRAHRQKELERMAEENVLSARNIDFDTKLKSWFNNRQSKSKTSKMPSLWSGFKKILDKKALGMCPQPTPPWRFYQSHPSYKDKIFARYQELHDDVFDKGHWLKNHSSITKLLYEEESDEVKNTIAQEAKARFEEELAEYEELLNGDWDNTEDPAIIESCQEQLPALITQLVELACKLCHTSFSGVFMGSNVDPSGDENKIFTASVLASKTSGPSPQRFDEWDPIGYKFHHVKSFAQFFVACLPVTPPTFNPEQLSQDSVNFELPFTLGGKKHASASADEDSDRESEENDYDQLDALGNEEQVDTPPSTPKLPKNRRLGPDLRAELESMETKERRFFEIENNKAKNRKFMKALNFDTAVQDLTSLMTKGTGSKPKKTKPSQKETSVLRRSVRQAGKERSGERKEEEDQEGEEEEEEKAKGKGKVKVKEVSGKVKGKHKEEQEQEVSGKVKGKRREKPEEEEEEEEEVSEKAKGKRKAVSSPKALKLVPVVKIPLSLKPKVQEPRTCGRPRPRQRTRTRPQDPSATGPPSVPDDPMEADPSAEQSSLPNNPMEIDPSTSSDSLLLPMPVKKSALLEDLRSLVLTLPANVPKASSDSPWAVFEGDGWVVDEPGEDAWEEWNRTLDRLLQKSPTESLEDFQNKLVLRGPKGTPALFRALVYVSDKIVFDPSMLDGKVQQVIEHQIL